MSVHQPLLQRHIAATSAADKYRMAIDLRSASRLQPVYSSISQSHNQHNCVQSLYSYILLFHCCSCCLSRQTGHLQFALETVLNVPLCIDSTAISASLQSRLCDTIESWMLLLLLLTLL